MIEKINELLETVKNYILEQNPKFNQEIINLLFYQPYIKATHIVNATKCGITSRQTASKKLDELVKLNMIGKKQVGTETVYINHQLIDILSQE